MKKIEEVTNRLTKARGPIKDIQSLAQNFNISIEFERKKISEGWENKPKEMIQVLWERGFINLESTKKEVLKYYSANGKKNGNGLLPVQI